MLRKLFFNFDSWYQMDVMLLIQSKALEDLTSVETSY